MKLVYFLLLFTCEVNDEIDSQCINTFTLQFGSIAQHGWAAFLVKMC